MAPGPVDPPSFAISDVSGLLGIPMPTLRSWDLRYGVPSSSERRIAGSERRYSPADVRALTLMRDEISRGLRAGQAAESVRTLLTITGPGIDHVRALLDAALGADADAVRAELDAATSDLGPSGCLDDVLFPALRQVGLLWQTNRSDIAPEHWLTRLVCAWLRGLANQAPSPLRAGPVLLVAAPKEQHVIGLHAMHALLRHDGTSSFVLPNGAPPRVLAAALREHEPRAVVFVCHLPSGRASCIKHIAVARGAQTVDRAVPALFYSGNAYTSARSRRGMPGTYLGSRLGPALQIISGSAASDDPR